MLFGKRKVFDIMCDALHDLLPFVQSKICENHPWRSVNLLKLTLLHECFSRFLNCTNGNKSRNAPHMKQCFLFQ